MSTPPFVTLPRGVERISFRGQFGDLAALVAHPAEMSRGTVLLIPGFTGSKEDFIALLPLLRDVGYQAVSYDHRGQFESPGPDSIDDYSMSDFVADASDVIERLVAEAGQPLHLVGHSFGGLVARETILDFGSSRADSHFESLTLLASGPGPIPGELRILAQQLIDFLPDTDLQQVWDEKEELDRASGWTPPSDEVREFLQHRFVSNNPCALRAKASILMNIPDRVDELAELLRTSTTSALVAFGDTDDRWTPSEQDEMAQRLRVRRFRLPSTGHSPAAEHPEWTAAALEAFFADAGSQRVRLQRLASVAPNYANGMELRIPVPTDPTAVRAVRKTLTRMLEAWGIESVIDDFQVVVSEIVTNAIRYGSDPVVVSLSIRNGHVRIAVADTNTDELPTARPPTETEASGRGLHLIDALTSGWGVDEAPGSKAVWAEIPIDPGAK